jgi:glycosyltransferase involved in cell wall biosynthesis
MIGGIGTYVAYAAKAMAAAGHEVHLLTWTYDDLSSEALDYAPFTKSNVRVLKIEGQRVWDWFPSGPYNHGLAYFLLQEIWECVENWQIDVVEATDYLSPALAFFQDLQSRGTKRNILCVTFNHGLTEDFYDADQIIPKREAQDDLVGERQQCRLGDLVIAPSATAVRRLKNYGIIDNVSLVREPYEFSATAAVQSVRPQLTYLGRISISKGIDKIIFFANQIEPIFRLENMLLIGKKVNSPFKTFDIEEYVRTRLNNRLRSLVVFTGSLGRAAAMGLLTAGAISPTLGSAETFSYSCIETIDRGLVPIVRHGTPMAEFFPPELQGYVFDEKFSDTRELLRAFEKLVTDAAEVVSQIQIYNRARLEPRTIAQEMGELYDTGLRSKKDYRAVCVRKAATVDDVTVLIPAYKPEHIFAETIDSIAKQTTGTPKVLICDDGTPPVAKGWFDYARLVLPTCSIIEQPNSGLLGARNTLIRECNTRLAIFLDADDILNPRYLERTLEAYNESILRPDAVLTNRLNFFENDEIVIRTLIADHFHLLRNDLRMTALIETEVLREIGFDSTRRNGEADDWVFWVRFTSLGYRSVVVPARLFHFRFRHGSMSWPWSMGQTSGTHTMLREAVMEMIRRRPREAAAAVGALHSSMTSLS